MYIQFILGLLFFTLSVLSQSSWIDTGVVLPNDMRTKVEETEKILRSLNQQDNQTSYYIELLRNGMAITTLRDEKKIPIYCVCACDTQVFLDTRKDASRGRKISFGTICSVFEKSDDFVLIGVSQTFLAEKSFEIATEIWGWMYVPWTCSEKALDARLAMHAVEENTDVDVTQFTTGYIPLRARSQEKSGSKCYTMPGSLQNNAVRATLGSLEIYYVYSIIKEKGKWYYLLGTHSKVSLGKPLSVDTTQSKSPTNTAKSQLLGWVNRNEISDLPTRIEIEWNKETIIQRQKQKRPFFIYATREDALAGMSDNSATRREAEKRAIGFENLQEPVPIPINFFRMPVLQKLDGEIPTYHVSVLSTLNNGSIDMEHVRRLFARLMDEQRKTDICFLLDSTGSMQGIIASAKEGIYQASLQLRKEILAIKLEDEKLGIAVSYEDRIDCRVRVILYRDHKDDYLIKSSPFFRIAAESELGELQKFLNEAQANGGGDALEQPFDAIIAATKSDWDPNAFRVITLLGDYGNHERIESQGNQHTIDTVLSALIGSRQDSRDLAQHNFYAVHAIPESSTPGITENFLKNSPLGTFPKQMRTLCERSRPYILVACDDRILHELNSLILPDIIQQEIEKLENQKFPPNTRIVRSGLEEQWDIIWDEQTQYTLGRQGSNLAIFLRGNGYFPFQKRSGEQIAQGLCQKIMLEQKRHVWDSIQEWLKEVAKEDYQPQKRTLNGVVALSYQSRAEKILSPEEMALLKKGLKNSFFDRGYICDSDGRDHTKKQVKPRVYILYDEVILLLPILQNIRDSLQESLYTGEDIHEKLQLAVRASLSSVLGIPASKIPMDKALNEIIDYLPFHTDGIFALTIEKICSLSLEEIQQMVYKIDLSYSRLYAILESKDPNAHEKDMHWWNINPISGEKYTYLPLEELP